MALTQTALAAPAPAAPAASASGSRPWTNAHQSPATRAAELLAAMTLPEKLAMLHGTSGSAYAGSTPANARLGIPALNLEDGPAGVGDGMNGVTQLPAPIAGAASWDPSTMRTYGQVVGAEQAAKGANVDLGPTVNIVRDPRWGRAFESYGEDPYLTSQMGDADIEGVQSQGVLAQVKHFAVYNQETNRNTPADDAQVDERTLHELYLPQFESAVKDADVASVMCSYSVVNDAFACQNAELQNTILKEQWGFQGFVTSDWGATHSTVPSVENGLDMEMPTGTYFGDPLTAAVADGQVSVATIDDHVTRILTEMFRFGLFDRAQTGSPDATATTPAHVADAKSIAEQGTVLLKNDGNQLPLDTSTVKSIAVIGQDAGAGAQSDGGGSAGVNTSSLVTPLAGITARAGKDVKVSYAQGPSADGTLPTVPSSVLTAPDGSAGLQAQFWTGMTPGSGDPVLTRTDPDVDFNWGSQPPASGLPATGWSARWTGNIDAPSDGTYTFSLSSDDGSRLYIDGKQVIDNWRDQATNTETATVTLTAGEHSVQLDYYQNGGNADVSLGWLTPGQDLISQAAQTASSADVAVVFASDYETEGADRSSLELPGQQDQLIEEVAKANPHTIVVLNTGDPVLMPWIDSVPGVVEAWYPGQEDGDAIAAVLFGDTDPGGRLPVSFPRATSDLPTDTAAQWPGTDGTVQYSEGLDVGYRWYDDKGIAPLFPFGYGLSYTTFRYSHLTVEPSSTTSRSTVTVGLDVTNTGHRTGSTVAQVYVGDPASAQEPSAQLKGFRKVTLAPGRTTHVTLTLDPSAFAHWDTTSHSWVVSDGAYTVSVGTSSAAADQQAHATVNVRTSYDGNAVALSAPGTLEPGGSGTLTATFTDRSDAPASDVRLSLPGLPKGWTATPAGATTFDQVAPGASVKAAWKVTLAADAAPGAQQAGAAASWQEAGRSGSAQDTASVTVPYTSLAAAYDNTGAAPAANPSLGNFDGGGYSYQAEALAAAGASPGATITAGGHAYTWPDVSSGAPDNVTAGGQTIDLSGSGAVPSGGTLGVLGAGTNGAQSGTVTVEYTDGSTSTAQLSLADWYSNATSTGVVAVTAQHWTVPSGDTLGDHAVSVYAVNLPLTEGKTPARLVLPVNSRLHVFALALP